jgi:hypothetical protein
MPSATVRGNVTWTGMPQARRVSTCSRTFSSTLAITRSAPRSRISSSLGFFAPPTRTLVATPSGGWVQCMVQPTTRSPAPMTNRVSVMLGMRETIRPGGTGAA